MSNFMKSFHFERNEDVSGMSGTGVVAVGCQFIDTGEVVVHWLGAHASTNIYHSIDDVVYLHGHEGRTRIVFDDLEDLPKCKN